MRNPYLTAVVAIGVIALLPLTGCGDGDDQEVKASNDRATIVKSDFIQAANAACEERNAEMKAKIRQVYAKAANKSRNAAAKQLINEVVAPGFEKEVEDLRALQPPPGDEEEVEEVITAIEQMVKRTKKDLAQGREYPYRKTENIAAAYGLPACGHP